MIESRQCCGTCKYHVPGEIPGEGDWICNNGKSEYYGLETGYDDECMDWEKREGAMNNDTRRSN